MKSPFARPWKTRFPAVTIVPGFQKPSCGASQTFLWRIGSQAISALTPVSLGMSLPKPVSTATSNRNFGERQSMSSFFWSLKRAASSTFGM